jgi:predicted Zn-dependent protease
MRRVFISLTRWAAAQGKRYTVSIARRRIVLRVVTFVVSLWLLVAGCTRSPDYYVERGNKLYASGKLGDAALEYRKALQKDVKFGEAHYRLGLTYIGQKNFRDAYDSLRRAVELMPAREDAKVQLANVCLEEYLYNRRVDVLYGQVEKISNELLAKNANSFDGLRLKGTLALSDKRVEDALHYLQKANQVKPMDPDVIVALSQALILDKQFAAGEKLALEMIQKDKTFGPIYDVLYRQYIGANRPGDAERILKEKVDNNPTQSGYVLQLAEYYAAAQKLSESTAALQRLLNSHKDFPDAHMLVGDFYGRMGKWEQASAQYQEGAHSNPKEALRYAKRMVTALLAEGKKAEAGPVVDAILKDHPKDEEARAVKATLLLDGGKPENLDAALAEFQALVKEKPEDPALWFNLGRAQAVKGDANGARGSFSEAIRQRSNYLPPRFAQAVLSLKQEKPDEVLRYTNEILAIDPNNAEALLLRATGLNQMGKYNEARSQLVRLQKEFPRAQQVQVQLGVSALGEKKFKEAEEIFGKLHQTGPDDMKFATGLVETYFAESQVEKALQFLQDALKKSPDSVPIRMLLASTAARAGNYDLAISEYQKLLSNNPKSAGVYLRLGSIYGRKGDLKNAIVMFEQARQLAPKDPTAAAVLGNTLITAGRAGEARTEFEHALTLRPDDPYVQNALAYVLTETGGDLDEAQRLAERAIHKVPDQSNFADTLGWIYLKKKMNDSALAIFRKVVQQESGNPTFRYHLAMVLFEMGNKQGAKSELNEAQARKPSPDQAQKITELMAKLN